MGKLALCSKLSFLVNPNHKNGDNCVFIGTTKSYLMVRLKISYRIYLSRLTVDPAMWQGPSLVTEDPRLHFVSKYYHIAIMGASDSLVKTQLI